jgi:hypothetical protein
LTLLETRLMELVLQKKKLNTRLSNPHELNTKMG